jgi:hypothetical protein
MYKFELFVKLIVFCRHWLFDEASHRANENEARPNVGNNVPFGAGGFDWQ